MGANRRPGGPSRGGRDRRGRARLRPALLAHRGPARQPAPEPGPCGCDREAGDPPLPECRGAARRAGGTPRGDARRRLRRDGRPGGLRRSTPGDPPLRIGPGGLRGGRPGAGVRGLHLRALLPEGGGGNGRQRPPGSGSPPPGSRSGGASTRTPSGRSSSRTSTGSSRPRARRGSASQRRSRQRMVMAATRGAPGSTTACSPVASPFGGPVWGSTQTPSSRSV